MKIIYLIFIFLLGLQTQHAKAIGQHQAARLKVSTGELIFENNTIKLNLNKVCPSATQPDANFWSLQVQGSKNFEEQQNFVSSKQEAVITNTPKGFKISYDQLNLDGKKWNISVVLNFETQNDAFHISAEIKNNVEGYNIIGFVGPIISGIDTQLSKHPLIMPCGMGQKFTKEPTEKEPIDKVSFKGGLAWAYNKQLSQYEITANYPSRFATMQWCALAGDEGGLYLGAHDDSFGAKSFSIRHNPENKTLGLTFRHQLVCSTGNEWKMQNMVLYPYRGQWHVGADSYRAWFDTAIKLQDVPQWAKNSGGWMLTIMKQQNEEIMWNYDDLDEMATLSSERGLDVLGLYGWAHGGHDRFYPDYFPDEPMGGEVKLKRALKNIRDRGMRSIIYVNGQLIDQNGTDYWGEIGKDITVKKANGELDYQKWWKYRDAPARFHGMACLGSDQWYERMLYLAVRANELGADGIIYDQLAVTAPKFCYADNHGHEVPAVVYEQDRYRLLTRIADYMKTINPDFIIMTEGLSDVVMNSVSAFHGYSNAVYVPKQFELDERYDKTAATFIYPEMYKYTFTEMLTTVRNPAPVANRLILNYATVYGMRQELESRYAADVSYLKEDRIPKIEDYSNIVSKPDLDLVTTEDPQASKVYIKKVIDFQRAYSEILWHGKYEDDKGFILQSSSPSVIGKAYTSGNITGIVVWNTGTKEETVKVDVPGYRLDYITSPEKVDVKESEALDAESIRLYVWKKSEQ